MSDPVDWRQLNDPNQWPVTRVGWLTDDEREAMRRRGRAEVVRLAEQMPRVKQPTIRELLIERANQDDRLFGQLCAESDAAQMTIRDEQDIARP